MLLTKLHIPSLEDYVLQRSELFDKLDVGLKCKLILISAPAGFGKTTVISDWIKQRKIPTAWYSIDNSDNDPVEFFSYIISGIKSIKNDFGDNALKLLRSPQKPSNEAIAKLLINEILGINKNFLLVLDDFHLINNSEIVNLIMYFLEHIPKNIHFAILTRSDPCFPLSRLRSHRQIVELRLKDLSFKVEEISYFFNKKLKIKMSEEDALLLETKTEGWIAGLQLTALMLQGQENYSESIQNINRDNQYVLDYLIEEVVKNQSKEITDFLEKTSILKQISSPLCDFVLHRNNSHEIIDKLRKNNLFIISLDNTGVWYRYHHLFADLLKQRLYEGRKNEVFEIHNQASVWYENNKMFDFAIEHALAVQNYDRCILLIAEVIEGMWTNGQHSAIKKYCEQIPDIYLRKSVICCLFYSWILINTGSEIGAENLLKEAEEKVTTELKSNLLEKSDLLKNKILLGKISVVLSYLNSMKTDLNKTFHYCDIAFENLSNQDSFWYSWIWLSHGIANFSVGNLEVSLESFQKAYNYALQTNNINLITVIILKLADNEQQFGNYKSSYDRCVELLNLMKASGLNDIAQTDWTYARVYLNLAYTCFVWGDIEESYKNILLARKLSINHIDITIESSVYMFYSFLLFLKGNNELSFKMLNKSETLIKKCDNLYFYIYAVLPWKLTMLIKNDMIEEAERLINENGFFVNGNITHSNEGVYLVYARLLIYKREFSDALFILDRLNLIVSQHGRVERLIDIKISYSLYYLRQNQTKQALKALAEALELASKDNLVGFFIVCIDDLKEIIVDFFEKVVIDYNKYSKVVLDKLKQLLLNKTNTYSLSKREMEILKLLGENLTNKEIADKMYITINTVKTHLKNILLKLEVDGRSNAVKKAKELNMI